VSLFLRDVSFAVRSLGRSPGFTLAVLAILALGIGTATAAFTALRGVVLRPLPYPNAESLVVVWETDPDDESFSEAASGPDLADFRAQSKSFAALAGTSFPLVNLQPNSGPPERVQAVGSTVELLPMLGARAQIGRLFVAGEDAPAGPPVAVLSDAIWQRSFGGDPAIVGRRVMVDGRPVEVIGVLSPEMRFADGEVWLPLPLVTPFLDLRGVHNVVVYGLLREDVTLAAAQAEMDGIAARLASLHPDDNAGRGVRLEPLQQVVVGTTGRELWLLAGAVGLVLAVVCANVAGLWLVRAFGRRHELALRAALGATRGQLRVQLLVESGLVAVAGAAGAVLVARAVLAGFVALRPDSLPRASELAVDGSAVGFALAIGAFTGVLFGALPLLSGGLDFERLRSRGGGGMRRGARAALVVAEVAMALVLVSGASLLARSLWRLAQVDPGFTPRQVMSFGIELPAGRYPMPARDVYPKWPEAVAAYARLEERLAALPGVEAVALAANNPLQRGFTSQVTIAGRPEPEGAMEETRIHAVSPAYHRLLGVPLRSGRHLDTTDTTGSEKVVVVNEAFARKHFPAGGAVGQVVSFWGGDCRIVGIVGDVRFRGLDQPSEPAIHPVLAQLPFAGFRIFVESPLSAAALERSVREAVASLEPDVALYDVAPVAELVAGTYGVRRFVMVVFGAFAAAALLLAALGIYGILSFQALQRRREMGIRQALGAARGDLLRLVGGEGFRLTLAGVALGIVGSAALTRALGSLLYEVTPLDPAALLGSAAVLLAVGCAASWLPARRAAHTDPMEVLRPNST
jgi:putative ABC transport system permease protein